MFRYQAVIAFFTLVVLLASCEYRLKDEYFKEVNRHDSANILITLNDDDNVCYLSGISTFDYKAYTDSLNLYEIKVFVDSSSVLTSENSTGHFTLDCNNYADGLHSITIVATTSSNSGSIADLVGAEGFIFSRTWDLVVDKSPPEAVQITKIYDAGGILKVEWNKYLKPNFWRYEVLKSVNTIYGYQTQSLASIAKADRNYFYDSSFVGGEAEYFVRVLTPMYLSATSGKQTFTDSIPGFSIEWLQENQVKVSWEKCKYYKAFKNYYIRAGYDTSMTIKDVSTLSCTGNFGIFGESADYEFNISTQKPGIIGAIHLEKTFSPGDPFRYYTDFLQNQVNNQVFLSGTNYLYKYNLDTGQTIDSLLHPVTYARYFLSPANDIMVLDDIPARVINPQTYVSTSLFGIVVKSRNLSLAGWGVAYISGELGVYDYKNRQKISDLPNTTDGLIYISEDSKYIFSCANSFNVTCYNIENGQQVFKWTHYGQSALLIPGQPGKILIYNAYNIQLVDVASGDNISSFPATANRMLDLDPVSKVVRLSVPEGYEFYKYETGVKVKTIKATYSVTTNFKNGVLYSGFGRKMPLLNIKK